VKNVQTLSRGAAVLCVVLTAPAVAFAQFTVTGLIEQQHCMFCHTTDGADLAPSFSQIAQRYRTSAGASVMLEKKLLVGGKAHWGDITMPAADPVPPLSDAEAHTLIQWVLSR
jgi:cytochrome c